MMKRSDGYLVVLAGGALGLYLLLRKKPTPTGSGGYTAYEVTANAAGGIWLTYGGSTYWVPGTYNLSQQFVAANPTARQRYNAFEASRGSTAVALLAPGA